MVLLRLNKYLADQGICSRREAEKLIADGQISVNGLVITMQGVKIDPEVDQVQVSEKGVEARKNEQIVIALNKPKGYVTSTKKTAVEKDIVLDLIKEKDLRLFPVGRLDKDTSGLLILTNNGDLAYKLTHPKFDHQKTYLLRLSEPVSDGVISKISNGVNLFGQKTKKANVEKINSHQILVTITEGKNRQIRRVCRKLNINLVNLKRVAIGRLSLENLKLEIGQYRILNKEEIELLKFSF